MLQFIERLKLNRARRKADLLQPTARWTFLLRILKMEGSERLLTKALVGQCPVTSSEFTLPLFMFEQACLERALNFAFGL